MRIAAGIIGCFTIGLVLIDSFLTIVLARRTRQSFRITRAFYKLTWAPFSAVGRRIRSGQFRETYLGIYGPLSLPVLFGCWAALLIAGFGLLQWALRLQAAGGESTLGNDFYRSAITLFTLGTGDPENTSSRIVSVWEGGTGFLLLGLVVGYLPVLYEAFSRREVQISLLDARSGSPPTACELLRLDVMSPARMERYLEQSEKWAAEILENHLSFPMLAWFRSHHANQSWLSALTAMTDCAAVISLCAKGDLQTQSELTFAMNRHVLVDLCNIFSPDRPSGAARNLSASDLEALVQAMEGREATFDSGALTETSLRRLTHMYEPYAQSLAAYLLMGLPAWTSDGAAHENWRIPRGPGREESAAVSDPFRS